MFVGHLAMGLTAKRVEPATSLGTFVLAALLPDLIRPFLMVAGVEQIRFKPGRGAANYLDAVNIAWSHSLAMNAVWATLAALAYWQITKRRRAAWLVLVVALSHWLLDVASHRPDMPLAPGLPQRLGLGLWTSTPATLIIEGGMWLAALVFYARATRSVGWSGVALLWTWAGVLTLLWINNITGARPPASTAAAGSLIVFSLTAAWAFWIDRARVEHS